MNSSKKYIDRYERRRQNRLVNQANDCFHSNKKPNKDSRPFSTIKVSKQLSNVSPHSYQTPIRQNLAEKSMQKGFSTKFDSLGKFQSPAPKFHGFRHSPLQLNTDKKPNQESKEKRQVTNLKDQFYSSEKENCTDLSILYEHIRKLLNDHLRERKHWQEEQQQFKRECSHYKRLCLFYKAEKQRLELELQSQQEALRLKW